MDLLGYFLRGTSAFRGRGRLVEHWLRQPHPGPARPRLLPGGATVPCDLSVPYEAMVWLRGEEEAELRILPKLLRPGQTFVDGGANIGVWTLVAAHAVRGAGGRVFALEPNPVTYRKLSLNIEINHLQQTVQTVNVACGAQRQQLPFHCSSAHNISRIADHVDGDTIPVQVQTLDSIIPDRVVAGIKLDIEGFEMNALRGCTELLRDANPWLAIEFNTALAGVDRLGDWDVHQHLTELGYSAWRFTDADRHTWLRPLPPHAVARGYCNLYYRRAKP
jgi:FkbM family methyltransferase